MVADIGVDRVGKIDRRRALGQGHDLGLWREDIDRIGEQVDLDMLQKFIRIARLILDVDQGLQPTRAQRLCILGAAAFLVHPMRGDAGFCHQMHGFGANLELNGGAQRADQSRVQRLVTVGLGDRDVILETAWLRLVELMQHAQAHIAIRQIGHDDTKAEDVTDLGKTQVFFAHLLVDRVERLFTALDFDFHSG